MHGIPIGSDVEYEPIVAKRQQALNQQVAYHQVAATGRPAVGVVGGDSRHVIAVRLYESAVELVRQTKDAASECETIDDKYLVARQREQHETRCNR